MIRQGRTLRMGRSLLVAGAIFWSVFAAAQVAVPPLTGHVVDQTGTLSSEQKATLEQTLVAFEARKGSQLAVLIVASTAPEEVEQFALRVAEKWKLGRKKVDDGAILVVAKNDRAVRIEVGYGLEGALPDAITKRIIAETIVPPLKSGDLYAGVNAGVEQMLAVIQGEALPAPTAPARSGDTFPVALFLAFFCAMLFRARTGSNPLRSGLAGVASGGLTYLFTAAIPAAGFSALAAIIVASLFGGTGGPGSWVSSRRYGGFPGGFGGRGFGGGFGGGGGGSFGGGGASGSW